MSIEMRNIVFAFHILTHLSYKLLNLMSVITLSSCTQGNGIINCSLDEMRIEARLRWSSENRYGILGRNYECNFKHTLVGQGLTAVNGWIFSLWK